MLIHAKPGVDCILIPVVRHDWTSLCTLLRTMPSPCILSGSLALVLSLDAEWVEEEKNYLLQIIKESAAQKFFSHVEFLSCNIPAHESVYIKHRLPKNSTPNLKYGLKSGPNIQFFRSVNHILETMPSVRSLLLMEADLIPLGECWLDKLNMELESADGFLLAGARYKGGTTLPECIADHINGNAVLNLSHPRFVAFISSWEQLLIECMPIAPENPYDVIIEWALAKKDSFTDTQLFQLIENMEKLYCPGKVYLETIVNLGGPHESAPDFDFSVVATLERFPQMSLLHCKAALPFADRLRNARCPEHSGIAGKAGSTSGQEYKLPSTISCIAPDEAPGSKCTWEHDAPLHAKTMTILSGINGGPLAISQFALIYATRIMTDAKEFERQIRSSRVLRKVFRMTLNTADVRARKQLLSAMLQQNIVFDDVTISCGDSL